MDEEFLRLLRRLVELNERIAGIVAEKGSPPEPPLLPSAPPRPRWRPDDLLTVEELAEYLKISPSKLRRLGLPSHRIGAQVRYRFAEVLDHLGIRREDDAEGEG